MIEFLLGFWRWASFLGLFNFAIFVSFDKTYEQVGKQASSLQGNTIITFLKKIKALGPTAVPFILNRMDSKREKLYLFDSGDNLDLVGLEIEAISLIGSPSVPFLVAKLKREVGERNCDVALRAALVQTLVRAFPGKLGDFPFASLIKVKARLEKDCHTPVPESPAVIFGENQLTFVENEVGFASGSFSKVFDFR